MAADGDTGFRSLADRFPALRKLGQRYRVIPYIQQFTQSECGLASLAMVLNYMGRPTSMEEVRQVLPADRAGVSAMALLDAGRLFGLRGRGVAIDVDDLEFLEPGAILHWDLNHFVVFERYRDGVLTLVDPGLGRRTLPRAQVERSLSGVAILFEPSESFSTEAGRVRDPWVHLRRLALASGVFGRVAITSLLIQLLALAVPAFTTVMVDRILPRGDRQLFTLFVGGMSLFVVFTFATEFVREYLLLYLRARLNIGLQLEFMDRLIRLPYSFFQVRASGDLLQRLESATTIQRILSSNVITSVIDGVLILLYLLILVWVNTTAGLLVLGLGLLQVACLAVTLRARKRLVDEELQVQTKAAGFAAELLFGIETLKAMGGEQRALQHWSRQFIEGLNAEIKRGRFEAVSDSVLSALRFGAPFVVLAYGASLVLDGTLSLGMMLGVYALALGFLTPLASLLNTGAQLQYVLSHVERLNDVFNAEPEQDITQVKPAPKLTGGVELEAVSFRYGPLSPDVVRSVSVRVDPGQFIAIVGKSGSGKSTLASLLMGLNLPSSGTVRFDGVNLQELDLVSVRQQCGVVTQRPYLFQQTLRSNITGGDPSIPLDQVIHAAKLACIHDDVMESPLGYAMLLSEGGSSMSGGQAQRIALARALLRGPALLLLDEATSALDSVTERAVQDNLTALRCTRIVIAHRLSTVRAADRILVMDEGQIVEQGSHDELLDLGGVYATLVSAQLAAED